MNKKIVLPFLLLFITGCRATSLSQDSLIDTSFNVNVSNPDINQKNDKDDDSYFKMYQSSKIDETIRIYEDNYLSYESSTISFKALIYPFDHYFAFNLLYYYNSNNTRVDVDYHNHFLFDVSEDRITLLNNYSYCADFSFVGQEFIYVGQGNNIPRYHYKKNNYDLCHFLLSAKGVYENREDLLKQLGLEEYSSNVKSFSYYKSQNFSTISFSFPIGELFNKYDIMMGVEQSLLESHTVVSLEASENNYYNKCPNLDYYGFKSENIIKDTSCYDVVEVNGQNISNLFKPSSIISSSSELEKYINSFSLTMIRRDTGTYSTENFTNYMNYFDTSVFETKNIVMLGVLTSPSTVDNYLFANACIRNNVLSVIFNTGSGSGFAALSYRFYAITLPKDVTAQSIEIIT